MTDVLLFLRTKGFQTLIHQADVLSVNEESLTCDVQLQDTQARITVQLDPQAVLGGNGSYADIPKIGSQVTIAVPEGDKYKPFIQTVTDRADCIILTGPAELKKINSH